MGTRSVRVLDAAIFITTTTIIIIIIIISTTATINYPIKGWLLCSPSDIHIYSYYY